MTFIRTSQYKLPNFQSTHCIAAIRFFKGIFDTMWVHCLIWVYTGKSYPNLIVSISIVSTISQNGLFELAQKSRFTRKLALSLDVNLHTVYLGMWLVVLNLSKAVVYGWTETECLVSRSKPLIRGTKLDTLVAHVSWNNICKKDRGLAADLGGL